MSAEQTALFAPAPSTTRGFATHLSVDDAGKRLAYGCGSIAYVRDLNTGKTLNRYLRHNSAVTSVVLAPVGNLCASGDSDGKLRIWHVDPKITTQYEYQPISGPIRGIAWSSDGERIVAVGEGRGTTGAVLNVKMGSSMGELKGHLRHVTSVDFRKDRPFRIVAGGADSAVTVHQGPPFNLAKEVRDQHASNVTCVRFSPDNKLAASTSGKNTILIHDGTTGEVLRTIDTPHTGTIYSVSWSRDGKKLATASADKTVRVFDATSGSETAAVPFGKDVAAMAVGVAFTVHGLVALSLGGDLSWIAEDGSVRKVERGHRSAIKAIAVQPGGVAQVASVSSDGTALLGAVGGEADAAAVRFSGLALDSINKATALQDGRIAACTPSGIVVFDPSSKTATEALSVKAVDVAGMPTLTGGLVVLTANRKVAVVEGADNKTVAEVELPTAGPRVLSVAAGGNTVAVGAEGGVAYTLKFAGGSTLEVVATLQGKHTDDVTAVAVSDCGEAIVTGGSSNQIFVWRAADGTCTCEYLNRHSSRINALAFAPGSKTVFASASLDRSVMYWSLPNSVNGLEAKAATILNAHPQGATCVAFGRGDDTKLYTAGADACIAQWDVSLA